MNCTSGERTPCEIVSSKQTRRVLRIHERQVEKDALDEQEDADGGKDDANAGHDPVDIRAAGPAKDEEANGDQEGDEEGGDQTALWSPETMQPDAGFHAGIDVPPVPRDAYDDADGDGEEGQAELAEVEMVHFVVDEGEGFEEGVEDAVDDCRVDGGKGDARVEQHEFKGTPEGLDGDGARREAGLVDFRLTAETRVAC